MFMARRIIGLLLCIVGLYCGVRAFQVGQDLTWERSRSANQNSARILAMQDSQQHWRTGALAGIVLGGASAVLGNKRPKPAVAQS